MVFTYMYIYTERTNVFNISTALFTLSIKMFNNAFNVQFYLCIEFIIQVELSKRNIFYLKKKIQTKLV